MFNCYMSKLCVTLFTVKYVILTLYDLQLSYGSDGLEITLTRDVNGNQMLSGAVATKAEPYPTGQYKVCILIRYSHYIICRLRNRYANQYYSSETRHRL